MSQNIERKEPTFGQPSETTNPSSESTTEKNAKQSVSFSVRSNQSPGHTFTPVMKRPTVATSEAVETAKAEVTESVKQVSEKTANAPKLGFTFTPVEKETVTTKSTNEPEKMEQPKTESAQMERVIPTAATTEPSKNKLEKVPSKYRRLLLVLLLLLALLLIFFLLKPKAPETAAELQEQGNSLPIEFRPVDEEEAKRAEEEAKARLQAEQDAIQAQQAEQNTETAPVVAEPTPAVETTETVVAPAVEETPVQAEPVMPVVSKPATTNSVIYQAEKTSPAVKVAQPSAKPTSQPAQAVKPLKPTTATATKAETKPQAQAAKPAEKATKPAPVATATPAVASKTITVQKGVSLFQNFRDNGLEGNLPELNKMTKLNGATSRLQPGQKITVRLDKNNRIVEMNIGAGKYIRQADGSYIYK